MSPCNCGKVKQAQYTWVFVAPDGTRKTYTSEVQAQAAKIRAGGGTYQAVPR
jgi:hypothetical protein